MSWQPIETAPKDGTRIDLWVVSPTKAWRWPDASWMEAGKHRWLGPDDWTSKEGMPLHALIEATVATHWQPLPSPPTPGDPQ